MNADNANLIITPDTKVAELLKVYPQLEDVLIEISPSFRKLKNPVLRKTVAKVATLRQVAIVANIPLADLINDLRGEVGQEAAENIETAKSASSEKPDWFKKDKIITTFDARAMLEKGKQPLGTVMKDLRDIKEDDIYELITPFEPAPLIDKAREKGFDAWTTSTELKVFKTYFRKPNS